MDSYRGDESAERDLQSLNEALLDAVIRHDAPRTKHLLEVGADPNVRDSRSGPNALDDGTVQPVTPLDYVVFCVSDAMLTEQDLFEFADVARILKAAGADPTTANRLAEIRYGPASSFEGESAFFEVLRIIRG